MLYQGLRLRLIPLRHGALGYQPAWILA